MDISNICHYHVSLSSVYIYCLISEYMPDSFQLS